MSVDPETRYSNETKRANVTVFRYQNLTAIDLRFRPHTERIKQISNKCLMAVDL